MIMNVIEGGFMARSPEDLSFQLRKLADAVDAGEVTDFIATYNHSDTYLSLIRCSDESAIALSNIQLANAVDKIRKV